MKRFGLIGDVHAEDRLLGIALEHFGLVDLAGMQLQWLAIDDGVREVERVDLNG